MTDLSIEQRLALLEARLPGVAPLALVPPITVGSLTNVPAPGSQLAAQWAQDASARVVHRFANVAARDAQYPAVVAGKGAVCITTDTGTMWLVDATTTWAKIRMGTYGNEFYQATPSSDTHVLSTTAIDVIGTTLALPSQPAAGWLYLSATVRWSQSGPYSAGAGTGLFFHRDNAVAGPSYHIEDKAQETSHTLTALVPGIAGRAFNVALAVGKQATGGTGSGIVIAAGTTFQVIRYLP